MKKDTVLVVGSNGKVGSELARILKAEGYNVRGTTSKKSNDPSVAHINVATGEGISTAFEGVDKAFFMAPPGFADHYKVISPLIQEAKRRGLKKVILMTAMGANADANSPFRRAEIELEKSGLTYNIVRPNWFFQNFNTFWLQGIREQGKILLPVGTAKTSFIDAQDISAVIAKLFTIDKFDNRDIDITGPEALDHDQVAKAISEATGKKVVYEEIEPATLRGWLVGGGVPEDYTDFLLVILNYLKLGYNGAVNENVKAVLGREPRSVKDYAKDNKSAWV